MYDFASAVAEDHQNKQDVEGGCRYSEKINRTLVHMIFQESLKPLRRQRTTISGLTMTRDLRQGIQIRESKTQKSRSALRIFGRELLGDFGLRPYDRNKIS
jgi:hypothetical protein